MQINLAWQEHTLSHKPDDRLDTWTNFIMLLFLDNVIERVFFLF